MNVTLKGAAVGPKLDATTSAIKSTGCVNIPVDSTLVQPFASVTVTV